MTFTNYLKWQLTGFVESYKKYFWRTFATALVFTVLCFVIMALLLMFSDFDARTDRVQISLLSYFFNRYSANNTFSFVDLDKSVFLFFVSLFSIGLMRLTVDEDKKQQELSFSSFIKRLRGGDFISLLEILILCSVIDFGLFQLSSITETAIKNFEFERWLHAFLFLLRIYIPLILFSLILHRLTSNKKLKMTFKKFIFLFVSLWLFNEFANEISSFVRIDIFSLLLAPFDMGKEYLYESFLGIFLIAFYFVGYYSAMTTSLYQLEEK